MASQEKRTFKRGDFLTYGNSIGSFYIYGGDIVDDPYVYSRYSKKYSLLLSFEPRKYMKNANGDWDWGEYFRVNDDERTINTDKEDFWYRLCTKDEKETALKIMNEHGYTWDEETLSVISIVTGEIIASAKEAEIIYYGDRIKPITTDRMMILKKACKNVKV